MERAIVSDNDERQPILGRRILVPGWDVIDEPRKIKPKALCKFEKCNNTSITEIVGVPACSDCIKLIRTELAALSKTNHEYEYDELRGL